MDGDNGSMKPANGENLYHPEEAHPVSVDNPQDVPQAQVANAEPPIAEQESYASPQQQTDSETISWTASEFVARQKSAGWYALLSLAAVVIGAVVWLFTRDLFPSVAVFVGVLLLTFYAAQQPRQQSYSLDASGLTIGSRHLPYHEFRSFSVVPEGAFVGVELTPLKRFAMYTTLYLDPTDEDRIIGHLSQYLPLEETRSNLTDNLMRRIHF